VLVLIWYKDDHTVAHIWGPFRDPQEAKKVAEWLVEIGVPGQPDLVPLRPSPVPVRLPGE
jgi:hypothetical protein